MPLLYLISKDCFNALTGFFFWDAFSSSSLSSSIISLLSARKLNA
jgi:hypothetical protein